MTFNFHGAIFILQTTYMLQVVVFQTSVNEIINLIKVVWYILTN